MFGLAPVDLVTLAVYLLGITLLGIWMGRTVHTTTDYFVGGRRFGKLFATFHTFGTGTHSDQAVSVAAKTYTSGMSGIWYQWLWLFVTPFFWWIAPIMRRCRAITGADYFAARFGRSVAMLFVFVGLFNMMVNLGTMLKGSGAVIRATTGGHVNEDYAIIAMTVMFVTYGVVGGLSAAVVTDFIQGLLTILFSFILLPFAIYKLGGFAGLHEQVAQTVDHVQRTNPGAGVPDASAMWSLIAPGEIGVFYIAVIALNALVGSVTQPITMPMCNAARTEREAQSGYVAGVLIKRICTVSWTLLGICAFVMFAGMTEDDDIDQAFGLVAHKLLPDILPGLIGIFIASLLASIMSSCDSVMIACSALFTNNLYRPLVAERKSERHYINVGRIAAVVTVVGGVFCAYRLESVLDGLELFWKISAMMGIAFWAGLFWRRTTTAGAWAGTLLAFAALLFTSDVDFMKRDLWSFNRTVANTRIATLPSDLRPDLDTKEDAIPSALGAELARNDIELSEGAVLTVEAKDKKTKENTLWLIADADRCYTVIRRTDTDQLDLYANALPVWLLWKGELSLPWQMVFYLSVGTAGLVVVSLVTRRNPDAQLDRFYGVLRTPVQPNEVIPHPFRLPEGVSPAPQRKLIDRPDWELQRPTTRGIAGFLLTSLAVGLLIGAVVLLVRFIN